MKMQKVIRCFTDWRAINTLFLAGIWSEPHGVHKVCESQHFPGALHTIQIAGFAFQYNSKHSGCSLGACSLVRECASYGVSSREKE